MMGFKAFHSAQATIAGIETAHMIRKGQLSEENMPAYKQFIALAGLSDSFHLHTYRTPTRFPSRWLGVPS
jgi:hypothetical protein